MVLESPRGEMTVLSGFLSRLTNDLVGPLAFLQHVYRAQTAEA